jgi:fructose-1,6-bisphosphatase/inositol monophosphatase family enzyme
LTGVVIRKGQFIDGAALAFLAREAGGIATLLDGSPLPPLYQCEQYRCPGLVIASSLTVHQDLMDAIRSDREQSTPCSEICME